MTQEPIPVCQLKVHTPKVGSLTSDVKPSAEPVQRRSGTPYTGPGETFRPLTVTGVDGRGTEEALGT